MNELRIAVRTDLTPERWTTRSNESELTTRSAIRGPFDPAGPLPAGACLLEASAEPARRRRSPPWSPATSPRDVDIRRILVVAAFGLGRESRIARSRRNALIDARRTLRDATEDEI